MDKNRLITYCRQQLELKSAFLQQEKFGLEKSLLEETKSSAGDKHETGRAMIHLEMEQLGRQMSEAAMMLDVFNEIFSSNSVNVKNHNDFSGAIYKGSLVITDKGRYLLCVPGGKLTFENDVVYLISAASPLGIQLKGKKKNDEVSLNGNVYKIREVL